LRDFDGFSPPKTLYSPCFNNYHQPSHQFNSRKNDAANHKPDPTMRVSDPMALPEGNWRACNLLQMASLLPQAPK
jgi:hypothetical protein